MIGVAIFVQAMFFSLTLAERSSLRSPWIHAELAAGNYGRSIRNFNFLRRTNYTVLHKTLDRLVAEHGGPFLIYVNDWNDEWAQLAASSLKDYAQSTYPQVLVEVRVLTGNLLSMDFPTVDSAHLKNPDIELLWKWKKINFLQRLADHSKNGLEVTTVYVSEFRKYAEMNQTKFSRGDDFGLNYIYPNGHIQNPPSVFFNIESNALAPSQVSPMGRAISEFQPAGGLKARCRWILENILIPAW